MKVRWTVAARQDRLEIFTFIGADNPRAAVQMDELFASTAAKLSEFPNLGKPGCVPGTREVILHESYRLIYEIEADTLWILTLVHTARRWPPLKE